MKMTTVVASVIGSLAVYSTMVACTSMTRPNGDGGNGTGGGDGGNGGMAMGGQSAQGGSTGGKGGSTGKGGAGNTGMTGGMPEASADPESGSRLKAKYRTGDDGSKAYLPGVWFDSQRQEDCSFGSADDGKERCLPTAESYAALNGYYFSDAGCTVPVAYAGGGCAPKYVIGNGGSGCYGSPTAYTSQIFKVGAKLNQATLYIKSGASCTSTPAAATLDYFKVGAEVAPSSFVAGTVMTDP